MSTNEERLYRGQCKCHHEKLLVPTAMRFESKLFEEYKSLIPRTCDFTIEAVPSWYKYFNVKDINPYRAYFLSLVNLCIKVKQNHIFKCFCESPFFERALNANKQGTLKECYSLASSFFKNRSDIPGNGAAPMHHSLIKNELSTFQHLNYVYNKSKQSTPFPTMMLDWTTDHKTAALFGDEMFSIDTKKLFSMFRFGITVKLNDTERKNDQINKAIDTYKNGTVSGILPAGVKNNFIGILTYKDEGCNQLMVDQKAVTVFWPFQYKPDELEEQRKEGKGLGYELDFKIESKND